MVVVRKRSKARILTVKMPRELNQLLFDYHQHGYFHSVF